MIRQTLHLYQRAYRGLSPSVWLLAGVMLINRCGTMVLPFMTLYLTEQLHYSVTDTGIVMAIFGTGAFVGTFLGGRLTDRFSFYYVQLVSLLFSGVALLTLQIITDFYALCASVFIFTLFGDAFRPANQAAIAHYSDSDTRTRAFSLNRLAINLGWAIGGGIGGWLASMSYSLIFWADGLTCLIAGVVLWLFLPAPETSSQQPSDNVVQNPVSQIEQTDLSTPSPYRDTLFIGFVVCSALYFTVFMHFFSIVPLFFREVLQLSKLLIGGLMSLNGLLIVAVEMALVYSLEQRTRSKLSLVAGGVLLVAVAYIILSLPAWLGYVTYDVAVSGLVIALAYILFATFSEMLVMPFLQSFTVERSRPATRGQYLGLYAMGGALAQTTAPAFGSFMIDRVGFTTLWLILAGISLVSAGGFWWLTKQLERSPEPVIPVV